MASGRPRRERRSPLPLAALGLLLRRRTAEASGNMTSIVQHGAVNYERLSVRVLRSRGYVAPAEIGGFDAVYPRGVGSTYSTSPGPFGGLDGDRGNLRSARRRTQREIADDNENCHTAGRWHTSMTRPGTCTNDATLPESWLVEPMATFFTFETAEDCCGQSVYEGRPCGIHDCRDSDGGGGEGEGSAVAGGKHDPGITYPDGHICHGRMWHPDLTSRTPACTNTVTNYPGNWDDVLMVGVTMFTSSSECCATLWGEWKNKKEEKRMQCQEVEAAECTAPSETVADGGGGDDPASEPVVEECGHPWHPSRDGKGCSNGPPGTYPREWDGNLKMFASHDECCAGYYPNVDLEECTKLDYCSRGPTVTEQQPQAEETTKTMATAAPTKSEENSPVATPTGTSFNDGAGTETEDPGCGVWVKRKQCTRKPGCAWDYTSGTCGEGEVESPVEDSPPESCDSLNKKRCSRSALCAWDLSSSVCAEAVPAPGGSENDAAPSSACDPDDPLPFHPTTPEDRTCSNGPDVPASMAGAAGFSFETPEDCCAAFYGDGPCDVVDVCSAYAAAGGGGCASKLGKKCKKDENCSWDEARGVCGDA